MGIDGGEKIAELNLGYAGTNSAGEMKFRMCLDLQISQTIYVCIITNSITTWSLQSIIILAS